MSTPATALTIHLTTALMGGCESLVVALVAPGLLALARGLAGGPLGVVRTSVCGHGAILTQGVPEVPFGAGPDPALGDT